ncbi:MAG: hypothetical protein DHS80DRAFT_24701 [Piptocephalis tieghemiana]|nr:MAG: hypothetical protein DHS80DRAFT_24701 [Piptocephalis tieghemiana]
MPMELPDRPAHWDFRVSATMTKEAIERSDGSHLSILAPEGYRPVGWGNVPQPKNGSFRCRVNEKRDGWECVKKGPGALSPLNLTVKSRTNSPTPPKGLTMGYNGGMCSSNPTCPTTLATQASQASEEAGPDPSLVPRGEEDKEHEKEEEMVRSKEGVEGERMIGDKGKVEEGRNNGMNQTTQGTSGLDDKLSLPSPDHNMTKGASNEEDKVGKARTNALIIAGCIGGVVLLTVGFVIWRRAHSTISRSRAPGHASQGRGRWAGSLLPMYLSMMRRRIRRPGSHGRDGRGPGAQGTGEEGSRNQEEGGKWGGLESISGMPGMGMGTVGPRSSISSSLTLPEACLMSTSGNKDWAERWEEIRVAERLGQGRESHGVLRAISTLEQPVSRVIGRNSRRTQSMYYPNFPTGSMEAGGEGGLEERNSVRRSRTQSIHRGGGVQSLLGPGDVIKEESAGSSVQSVNLSAGMSRSGGSTVYHSATGPT